MPRFRDLLASAVEEEHSVKNVDDSRLAHPVLGDHGNESGAFTENDEKGVGKCERSMEETEDCDLWDVGEDEEEGEDGYGGEGEGNDVSDEGGKKLAVSEEVAYSLQER